MTAAHQSAARPVRALDYDPCPGDVAGVRILAAALRDRCELLRQVGTTASGWQPTTWRGTAAEAAVDRLDRLAVDVRRLQTSLEAAAGCLESWAARLQQLQSAADGLDAEAVENRRRHREVGADARTLYLDPTAGLDLWAAAERDRLQVELQLIKGRAGSLHQDYVAAATRQADELDATAARGAWLSGWGSTVWDGVHDRWRHEVRRTARVHDWVATTTSHAASAAGAVAAVLPFTAPVAVPAAVWLAGSSTRSRATLAAGAGGSTDAVLTAVTGTALSAVGVARGVGPAVQRAKAQTTGAGMGVEVSSWFGGRSGDRSTTTVPGIDGSTIAVTVHDVAEPWQVGSGVRGHGFAGVATVPTTIPPKPAATTASPQAPRPTPAPRTVPSPAPQAPQVPQPLRTAAGPVQRP